MEDKQPGPDFQQVDGALGAVLLASMVAAMVPPGGEIPSAAEEKDEHEDSGLPSGAAGLHFRAPDIRQELLRLCRRVRGLQDQSELGARVADAQVI